MKIITFYSYKGGVGRTLALANIACLMSGDREHPQKVLIWDFDLEAPGLHKLFPPKQPQKFGFVDLAYDYARTGEIADINDYIYESTIENIFVLPASGKIDNTYCNNLQAINWLSFFDSKPKDKGQFFTTILDSLNDREGEDAFDYILVDSRTGLNDQAGICTEVLSDLLVVLFRLSGQDFDGLDHLVPAIKSQLKARDKEKVALFPIASQVGLSTSQSIVSKYRKHAQEIFKSNLYYIRFDQDLVNNEHLLCLNEKMEDIWPTPPIIEDYKNICQEIRNRNENDSKTQANKLQRLLKQHDERAAIDLIKKLLRKRPFLSLPWSALLEKDISLTKSDQEDIKKIVDDIKIKYEDNHFAFNWYGNYYLNQAQDRNSEELQKAIEEFQKALEYTSESEQFSILRKLAKIKSSIGELDSAIALLKKARIVFPENNQIGLDLASLYIRKGSNYFTLACQELENMSADILDKIWTLAYLYAYLKEKEKVRQYTERLEEKDKDEEKWASNLQKAYIMLLEEKTEEALKLIPRKISDVMDLANWSEFYLCSLEFDKALELINKTKTKREIKKHESEYKHIEALIKYFDQNVEIKKEDVFDAWERYSAPWNFRELMFFKEFSLKTKKISKGKINIIEELIRRQDFSELKTSRKIKFILKAV